ncbi:hypothetical protein [Deinococcus aquaticus]|uniref:hypothetical protein n=1 Tax=Deinococcus aquaticus TaxID=328692 RepID=UPI00360C1DD1
MKFDQPATPNPIDQERVVTRPHTRIEGPLKVTGQAPYAYEYQLPETPTYGFVLGAGIARGRSSPSTRPPPRPRRACCWS